MLGSLYLRQLRKLKLPYNARLDPLDTVVKQFTLGCIPLLGQLLLMRNEHVYSYSCFNLGSRWKN